MNDTADHSDAPEGIWLTISELARKKGVNKSTISVRVSALEEEGRITTRKGAGTKLVELAEYDQAVGEITDLAKAQAAATARANRFDDAAASDGSVGGDATFRAAQQQKVFYEARTKALEFGRLTGQLVAIDRVNSVIAEIGEAIRQPISQLPLHADEISAAAARNGPVCVLC
jgi:DNA-binding transcriptional ArsR family regulator